MSPFGVSPRLDELVLLLGVADRVSERRHAEGISQLDLARRAGLSVKTVSHVECAKRIFRLPVYAAIARGLDCRLSDLTVDAEPAPEGGVACHA